MLTVGWETVLTILATLATATVFERLGWGGGGVTKVIALVVVGTLIVGGGVLGFDLIMRMQTVITVVTGVLTVVYIILVADQVSWSKVSRPAERLDPGRDRRAGLPDDRLRPRLGERGGRLLALPPALRVQLAA